MDIKIKRTIPKRKISAIVFFIIGALVVGLLILYILGEIKNISSTFYTWVIFFAVVIFILVYAGISKLKSKVVEDLIADVDSYEVFYYPDELRKTSTQMQDAKVIQKFREDGYEFDNTPQEQIRKDKVDEIKNSDEFQKINEEYGMNEDGKID